MEKIKSYHIEFFFAFILILVVILYGISIKSLDVGFTRIIVFAMGLILIDTGMNYIGIEKEEEYIKIAKARLKPFMEQTTLKD